MTSLWDLPDFDEHELVHFVTDPATGLRAVIGVHSTHLGPGAGGTRLWHYASPEDAIADALRLSRGMSYKNAMAGALSDVHDRYQSRLVWLAPFVLLIAARGWRERGRGSPNHAP